MFDTATHHQPIHTLCV